MSRTFKKCVNTGISSSGIDFSSPVGKVLNLGIWMVVGAVFVIAGIVMLIIGTIKFLRDGKKKEGQYYGH